MNVCDFLTWSKNIHGHLGLMINSCTIVGLKEVLNATSYKIIYQEVLKPFVSCQLQLKLQIFFSLQHFLLSTSLLILFQLCHWYLTHWFKNLNFLKNWKWKWNWEIIQVLVIIILIRNVIIIIILYGVEVFLKNEGLKK